VYRISKEFKLIVHLTKGELCLIDDSLTLLHPKSGETEEYPPKIIYRMLLPSASTAAPIELLDSIGAALLEAHEKVETEEDAGVSLDLSEEYLWLIREIANTNIMFGKEPVGYNIKIKVHQALRQIRRDEVIGNIKVSSNDVTYDRDKLDALQILESDE